MFIRGALRFATRCLAALSRKASQSYMSSHFRMNILRGMSLLLASPVLLCASSDIQPQIQEITKQELVSSLHKVSGQEFVVIVYDKFQRLKEKEFGEELAPIIEECRKAKIGKVYLIDSKERQHLQKITQNLRNSPGEDKFSEQEGVKKKKPFEVYYKGKTFGEAFQLERSKGLPFSSQIEQIRHYQFTANPEGLPAILSSHINKPWAINKTLVVKQCLAEGECVQSFKQDVRSLIEQGMLLGKKEEYQFYLVVDQPSGILGSSSEYIKIFMREAERLRGRTMAANRKEETYVFRRDLFGSEVAFFSEWLQRQGLNYSHNERFLMFLRPRVHIISRKNTMTDLMWYIRTARINDQVSLSLNNTAKFKCHNKDSLPVLTTLYNHFPLLNYLIINSETVGELIRHANADHKYVIFKQDGSPIWKKHFLDLDQLQQAPPQQQQTIFEKDYKPVIQGFIDNPQVNSLVEVEKQLQIGLEKLMILRNRQESKNSMRKYVVRVCKGSCKRFLSPHILQSLNEKLQEGANVYWIDSTAQNIGMPDGDYLLKDGILTPLEQALGGK